MKINQIISEGPIKAGMGSGVDTSTAKGVEKASKPKAPPKPPKPQKQFQQHVQFKPAQYRDPLNLGKYKDAMNR